ncbi:MAG: TIGR02678 family protein [Selenomonadaceae bacterium]|nr:TIGR02678 family protein [Selenomonadaceae bacterium]
MDEQEELRAAAQILLENRWVTRRDMPEEYGLIRRHEKSLRQFFRERCGWPLIVTARFYKLEKIPVSPEAFMGLSAMRSAEDYVLLACVMAFLEEYDSGSQFLLGELAEALLSYYPEDSLTEKLSWESYNWRKALIRVLNYLAEENIIRVVEDESAGFLSGGMTESGAAGEALYEVTSLARYFLRSFPREIQSYGSLEELAAADFQTELTEEAKLIRQRRQRIYRQLLLKPVYYRNEATEQDFLYLRNQYKRLAEPLEEWFGLRLELYENAVMALSPEQNAWFRDIFPVRFRGIHDIILHLAHYLREESREDIGHPLTPNEWQSLLDGLATKTKQGWTKEYREMSLKRLAETLLAEMVSWGMARVAEDGLITLLPALFRLEGEYPTDYRFLSKEEQ